jgi:serine protease Do
MPGVKKSEPQLSPPSSDTSLADLPYELRPVSPSQQAKVELRPDPTDANKASGGNRVRANASSPPVSRREQERERRVRENELRKRNQNLRAQNGGSLWPAYTLFTSTVLLLAAWLIGPRLVEEYNFAATRGRIRAQYENATEILKEHPLENVSRAFQLIAHKVRPSVVSVNATKTISGGRIGSQLTGFGSGVIMSPEGYIITNAHVLEDASACQVQLHDRSRYEATLVGVDTVSDLAVLKIDAKNLIPATWGDSDQASVGSIVWAIGSPYRYDQTVTSGILSGKDRPGDKSRKQNLLQTDAAVNPGNSGGPLVNADGDVIGINTSIYGESFQGISFAVPSSTAQFVYRQLIANGQVVRGYLGVHPIEVSHRLAASMTLPDLDGAILRNVVTNSPADLAGILPGDVIRSWNGKSIGRYNTLFQMAEMTQPNSKVEVVLIRNGQQLRKEVVVGELPKVDDYFDGLRSKRIPLPTPDIPQSPDRYRSAFPKPQLFPKP